MKKTALSILSVVVAMMVSCKKDRDDTPARNYPFYFTGDVNGISLKWEADDEGDSKYTSTTTMTAYTNPSNVTPNAADIILGTVVYDAVTIPSNMITAAVVRYFDHAASDAERLSMINAGNIPYGTSNGNSTTVNGAIIQYVDANGAIWSTQLGSQAGSTFTITEVADATDGKSKKIFKATFNCKIYNTTGGSMPITNGTIRGRIIP